MGVSGALAPPSNIGSQAFDPRIVLVGIQLQSGTLNFDGDAAIIANGRKFATAIMNECELRIFNLSANDRNNILSQASPLKLGANPPVLMTLDVGRESTGTFRLFEGNVVSSNITQPPDIGVSLVAMTNNFATGIVAGIGEPGMTSLKIICQGIAQRQSLTLDFQATDKQISNYSHNGPLSREILNLNLMSNVIAFVDNKTLVVLDSNKPRNKTPVLITARTGMIGIPQVTTYGVLVKIMLNNFIELGGAVTVQSDLNPAANGDYFVVGIDFEVSSRDQPFWYTLACQTPSRFMGT